MKKKSKGFDHLIASVFLTYYGWICFMLASDTNYTDDDKVYHWLWLDYVIVGMPVIIFVLVAAAKGIRRWEASDDVRDA